jgi:hypothetical protein
MFKPFLLLLLLVGACSTVPLAPQSDDSDGKAFATPPPGMGAVYIFRNDTIGGLRVVEITAGQRLIGDLAWQTWTRVNMAPGTHTIRCKFENPAMLPVTISEGEIRYVNVGFSIGRCLLNEVDAATARPAILAGKRAAEIK